VKEAPLPANETLRLSTLRSLNVLDTPREERFDRLTRLTRRMFQVPIAAISLVDEHRQWFKSCMGLAARETPRTYSFCAHAILEDGPLVIEDALKDERFFDNPLVTGEPRVRFYTGYPITAGNGCRLGTLAIIDHDPRGLTDDERHVLKDLGAMVERELLIMHPGTTDDLTGITNRKGFLAMAQRCLSQCIRHGLSATLVLFSLDSAPHERNAGAELGLTTFAEIMKSSFRESDLFARLDNDEFALLLSHTTAEGAERCAQRFNARMNIENASLPLDARVRFVWQSVEFDPSTHSTVDALLADARRAVHHLRRRGVQRPDH